MERPPKNPPRAGAPPPSPIPDLSVPPPAPPRSFTPEPRAQRAQHVATLTGLQPPPEPESPAVRDLMDRVSRQETVIRELKEQQKNAFLDSLTPPSVPGATMPPKSRRHKAYMLLLGVAAVVAAGGGFAACGPVVTGVGQVITAVRSKPEPAFSKTDGDRLIRAFEIMDERQRQLWGEVRGLAGYQRGALEVQQIETLEVPGAPPSADLRPKQVPMVDARRVRGKAPPIAQIPAPVVSPVPEPIDLGIGGAP